MLTNPTRYGLIACRYLVWGWHNGVWLNAPEIAERYRMNVRALSPALRRLVLAGILRSQCGGTRPGFMLSRPPEEVTMLEVVRAGRELPHGLLPHGAFKRPVLMRDGMLPGLRGIPRHAGRTAAETFGCVARGARRNGRIFGGV